MNDLQKLLSVLQLTTRKLAAELGLDYTVVQKVVTGKRNTPHIQEAIASHLGHQATHLFGPGSTRHLRRLIDQSIDACVEADRARLRRLYLRDRIANNKAVGNG